MKIVSGWFRDGRGWAIGIMVGALTLGSALPHLARWLVPAALWRPVLGAAGLAALAGGGVVGVVAVGGPLAGPAPQVRWEARARLPPGRRGALAHPRGFGPMG